MPRRSRQLSESKIYHVMLRGNERGKIFLDDEDKERFIDTLCERNNDKVFCIYAYCLMDNHLHLLINEGQEQITKIMQSIGVRYAYYFNKKYKRTGHLFQDRFKSEAIENESYLLAALRYIHNNPVKANLVENPAQYRWSSYNAYVNECDPKCKVIDRSIILAIFSNNEEQAVKLFIQYANEIENNEKFIDIQEEDMLEKRMNEADVRQYITEYLAQYTQQDEVSILLEKKDVRNELIRELKTNSNLSIRQIAQVLGIDRNIVQRVK